MATRLTFLRNPDTIKEKITGGVTGRRGKGVIGMKQIKLRIYTDGKIDAETNGVKGKACLDYISILERLTGAVTVDSAFTQDYYERDNLLTDNVEAEVRL